MDKIERMKLDRRKPYLQKCVLAAEVLAKYENDTTVRSRIFGKYIQPVIRVSYQSFNNMLNEKNPQKEIEEINKKITHEKTDIQH
jgi:hypothetical protein